MSREDATRKGVADAWDFWLSQHPVTVPELMEEAIQKGVTAWLDRHGADLFHKAVTEWLDRNGPDIFRGTSSDDQD